jgi:hypothetical protein
MNANELGTGDLCRFEDLQIGEAFYQPMMELGGQSIIFYKTGEGSYGIAPGEPEFPALDIFWVVGRVDVMQCRRCGCTEENPCFSFKEGACAWAWPGLCTACLNDIELHKFLGEGLDGHASEKAA